jgi:hypothetical protein
MRVLVLSLTLLLASCGSITETAVKSVAGAALGGSDGLSVDAQVGKTNSKTVGTSRTVEIAPVARPENIGGDFNQTTQADEKTGGVETVEKVDGDLVLNSIPPWLIVALLISALSALGLVGVIGWLSPQPAWLRRRLDYTES